MAAACLGGGDEEELPGMGEQGPTSGMRRVGWRKKGPAFKAVSEESFQRVRVLGARVRVRDVPGSFWTEFVEDRGG